MNREIKFRGWFQGINGTEMWVYGYLVKQTNAIMEKAHKISWKAFKTLFITGLVIAIWLLIDTSYKLAFYAAVNTIAFLINWAILIITGLNQKP